ncbi:hypothetical protein Sjap_005300 [Stephania japonica]|uniref:Uncharacterized protein n=1 Tax=Stephania japonica TaxID=461633 RepID=A0AAP0K631_9MAGN
MHTEEDDSKEEGLIDKEDGKGDNNDKGSGDDDKGENEGQERKGDSSKEDDDHEQSEFEDDGDDHGDDIHGGYGTTLYDYAKGVEGVRATVTEEKANHTHVEQTRAEHTQTGTDHIPEVPVNQQHIKEHEVLILGYLVAVAAAAKGKTS